MYYLQGMDSLEQKVRLAELKAKLAEERAHRNQAMLSQKMHEVNQLQDTLNHQTKVGLLRYAPRPKIDTNTTSVTAVYLCLL